MHVLCIAQAIRLMTIALLLDKSPTRDAVSWQQAWGEERRLHRGDVGAHELKQDGLVLQLCMAGGASLPSLKTGNRPRAGIGDQVVLL